MHQLRWKYPSLYRKIKYFNLNKSVLQRKPQTYAFIFNTKGFKHFERYDLSPQSCVNFSRSTGRECTGGVITHRCKKKKKYDLCVYIFKELHLFTKSRISQDFHKTLLSFKRKVKGSRHANCFLVIGEKDFAICN